MKKILLLVIFISSSVVIAKEMSSAATCIAENSGAGSIECLEKLYQSTEDELLTLDKHILDSLESKLKQNDITQVHYQSALSSLKKSAVKFKSYRDSSCDFAANYSGAVASGYQQVRWTCLIEKNQLRIVFLKNQLIKQ
jgi:uncharacterized protein YecT (DUF1311 family)